MKSKLNRTLLFCLSSALVAGSAFAQGDTTTTQGKQPGSATGRESSHGMMQQSFRGSKIIGTQVKSTAGENLGTIEDFIFNPRSGRIEFAALSATGPTGTTPTGAGEKLTLIPWKLLHASQTGGAGAEQYTVTAMLDQAKLSSAPSFDKNQWPDMSQPDWSQKYYSHYGISRESGAGGTGGTGSGLDTDKDKSGSSTEKGAGAGGLQK